jgi:CP family cyanate transporter-like MFS transporter
VASVGTPRLLAALFLSSLALRPQLSGVGPLLPRIQHDLGLSHAAAGLLGTIPVLCMGLFALVAPALVAQFGSRIVFGAAVALIGISGLARTAVPGAVAILILTLVFGIAAGVGGAVLPIVVKERFHERPAFATGFYSVGINIGAAASAAVAVPLAGLLGGWRAALAALAAVAVALAACWLVLTHRQLPDREPALRLPRLPWRSGVAWTLAAIFGLQATCFHGLSVWLADAYQEHGWTAGTAGALVAVFQFSSVPGTLLVSWGADRVLTRRAYLTLGAAVLTVSIAALEAAPAGAWVWAVAAGLACGSLFPLSLTLSVDVATNPAEAGAVAALMLGGGYTLAALAPVALGVARDAAGSFAVGVWMLAAVAGLLLLVALLLSPTRLQRAATA